MFCVKEYKSGHTAVEGGQVRGDSVSWADP